MTSHRRIAFFLINFLFVGSCTPSWEHTKTEHLDIYFEPSSYAARHVAAARPLYEALYRKACQEIPGGCSSQTISLYLHESLSIYGYANPEKREVHYVFSEKQRLTSTHEFLHIFLRELNPRAPLRLEEGVCRLNEMRLVRDDKGREQRWHLYQLAARAPGGDLSLPEIFKTTYDSDSQGNVAAAFVHYLVTAFGRDRFWAFYGAHGQSPGSLSTLPSADSLCPLKSQRDFGG